MTILPTSSLRYKRGRYINTQKKIHSYLYETEEPGTKSYHRDASDTLSPACGGPRQHRGHWQTLAAGRKWGRSRMFAGRARTAPWEGQPDRPAIVC